jgi:hypothetical protein
MTQRFFWQTEEAQMAAFLSTWPFARSLVRSWRRFAGRPELLNNVEAETAAFVPDVQSIPTDDLLCIRMRALGLDKAEVTRLWPDTMVDLRKKCIACDSRMECDAELKSPSESDAQNWQDYCPNVATLNMLGSLLPAMREVAPRLPSRDI